MYSYFGAFFLSLAGSLIVTPVAMRIAVKIGAVDRPNERKIHNGTVPRLGGLAIFFSSSFTLAFFMLIGHSQLTSTWIASQKGLAIGGGVVAMLLLGLWDDVYDLKPSHKFAGQVVISSVLFLVGVRISAITIPFVQLEIPLGMLSYPVTILWLTGVTNAFNLIDGLDGLASGIALITLAAIVPIVILRNDMSSVLLAAIYAGAIVGFLRYNFHPAKIFLGDSGSLMLGLVLAILSIQSSTKGSAVVAIIVPLLALGLPIMETLLSMMRRYLHSFLPESDQRTSLFAKIKLMFQPDRRHMHHRLLDQGFSHRTAVLSLYFVSCILAAGAFLVTVSSGAIVPVILLMVSAAIYVGIKSLRYKEMSVLHNGMLLPLYDRPILNRESFQVFMDIGFVLFSFGAASLLSGGQQAQSLRSFVWPGTVTVGIQLGVFWFMGLYRRGTHIVGINDILDIVKAALIAEITACSVFALLSSQLGSATLAAYILNFFFLLSFVLGSRCSHLILLHLFRQETKSGRKVLIYGANPEGLWMLERILQLNFVGITPIGFVDDDSSMIGKRLNGYAVYNSNGQLSKIARETKVNEIVICGDRIKPEDFKRLSEVAHEHKIVLTKASIVFEKIEEERPIAKGSEASVFHIPTHPVHSTVERTVTSLT